MREKIGRRFVRNIDASINAAALIKDSEARQHFAACSNRKSIMSFTSRQFALFAKLTDPLSAKQAKRESNHSGPVDRIGPTRCGRPAYRES